MKQETVWLGPGNKTVQRQELSCYAGHLAVALPALKGEELTFHWRGAPIPLETWRVLTSFLKWSFDEYGCEAQCRLAYNPETKEWRVCVLPQTITMGLATKEYETDADRETAFIEAGINEGFAFAGTVHHHCSSSAFQSGTDHRDEITQPGFHVTLGHLQSPQADYHSRASFRGIMYPEVKDAEWLPYDKAKILSLVDLPEFPEVWKTRLKKRQASTYVYKPSQRNAWDGYNERHGVGGHTGYKGYQDYGYCGQGYGTPDQLPVEAAKHTKRQFWMKTREYFWDYMIAMYNCFDEADLKQCKELLPIGSLAWNKACEDGAKYADYIVNQIGGIAETDRMNEFFTDLFTNKRLTYSGATNQWVVTKVNKPVDPALLYKQFGPGGTTPLADLRKKMSGTAPETTIGELMEPKKEEVVVTPEPKQDLDFDYSYLDQLDFANVMELIPNEEPDFSVSQRNMYRIVNALFEQDGDFADALETSFGEVLEQRSEKLFVPGTNFVATRELVNASGDLATLIIRAARAMAFARVVIDNRLEATLDELLGWDQDVTDRFWTALAESFSFLSVELLRSASQTTEPETKKMGEWLTPHILSLLIKAKKDLM